MGGQGLTDAITAGCDSIEHGYSLTQEHCSMMAQKGLFFDPTLVRYTEPYMDDNDAKNTGGKFRIIPIIETRISDLPVVPYRQDQSPRPDFWGSDVRHHTTEDDTRWVNYSTRRFSSRSTAF